MPGKIKAGIIGGAGYIGGEMLRLLHDHPFVDVSFIYSRSNAGKPIASVHGDFAGETDLIFTSVIQTDIHILFLCLGHGASREFLENNDLSDISVIVDMSQDFRLLPDNGPDARTFIYGLPEYNKAQIKVARNIANPGCFATAILLALLPLAQAKMLNEVNITGVTGATGAGQSLTHSSHFSWRTNNIQAYKSLAHQHVYEIKQTLQQLQPRFDTLNFIPWRGDFARGIYITAYTECGMLADKAYSLYEEYYKDHPFTSVSREMISMKQIINTNRCLLHLEKVDGKIVIHAVIDNLLKGAAGQAVQNMNIMFNFPEDAGLKLKPVSF